MASDTKMPPQKPAEAEFGPHPEDAQSYAELLDVIVAFDESLPEWIKSEEKDILSIEGIQKPIGFNPRTNAELTSEMLDKKKDLGSFISRDGLNQSDIFKLAQQRYIAGVFGFKVGPLTVNYDFGTANSEIERPRTPNLPQKPKRTTDGFVDTDGKAISTVRADAIYSSHFIANNPDIFDEPKAFEGMFKRVIEEAEGGEIEVKDIAGDLEGVLSTVRQIARVLGYKVGDYQKNDEGNFSLPIDGTRAGFSISSSAI